MLLFLGNQGHGQEHAQQQRHHGVADEHDALVDRTLTKGLGGEVGDGSQADEYDGQQDGRQDHHDRRGLHKHAGDKYGLSHRTFTGTKGLEGLSRMLREAV